MNRIVTMAFFAAVLAAGLFGGCEVGPTSVSDGTRAAITGSTGSTARSANIDGETWETATGTSHVPTNVVADATGLAVQSYGGHRTMTLAQGGAVVTLTDPLDGSLKGLRVNLADGTVIELDEFVSQPSATIAAYDQQVIASLEAAKHITSEQASVAREALEAGASLAEAIVLALGPAIGG